MKHWDEQVPPRDTWVMASYSATEKPRLLKTCKRGCCVYDPYIMENLILPSYWREATFDEVTATHYRTKASELKAVR